ncbi:MAG: hypothetical protein AAGC57_00080 [Pseudomonadota bacterium]
MHYAVIGWGSLIWDLDDLASKVEGPWQRGAGPVLPLEFSRISAKRKQSLVLVISRAHGDPCPTHVIASQRQTLPDVVRDLAERERTAPDRIGAVCLKDQVSQSALPTVSNAVADWCRANGWQGAVWTDLPENFAEIAGQAFSVDAAVAYVRRLPEPNLDEAVQYIERAPRQTNTPVRRRLAQDPWWRDAVSARSGSLR